MTERRQRILVVEDDPLVRIGIVDDLDELAFGAEEAGSASEALEKVDALAGELAAVILDVGLPGVRGDALAADLRQRYGNLPIVIASGYGRDELLRKFGNDSNITVLTKPFGIKGLRSALCELRVLEPSPA
jgi:CheY-like chemotaxis protein